MDASVSWQSGLRFEGEAAGPLKLTLASELGTNGSGDSFEPLELMLLGVAGCTAMDVISILEKKREHVTAFRVHAHAERASDYPKVFSSLHLEYEVKGHGVREASVTRAIELSQTKYCPAYAMLSQVVPTTSSFSILESP